MIRNTLIYRKKERRQERKKEKKEEEREATKTKRLIETRKINNI